MRRSAINYCKQLSSLAIENYVGNEKLCLCVLKPYVNFNLSNLLS